MSVHTQKQVQSQNDLDARKASQAQINKAWHNLHVNVKGLVVLSVVCLFAPDIAVWLSLPNPELAMIIQSPKIWGLFLTVFAINTLSYSFRLRNAIHRADSRGG